MIIPSSPGTLIVIHDQQPHLERICEWAEGIGVNVARNTYPLLSPTAAVTLETSWESFCNPVWRQPIGAVIHANYGYYEDHPLRSGDAVKSLLGYSIQRDCSQQLAADLLFLRKLGEELADCPVLLVTGGPADQQGWDELSLEPHPRLRWWSLGDLEKCTSWEQALKADFHHQTTLSQATIKSKLHKLNHRLRSIFHTLKEIEESIDASDAIRDLLFDELQRHFRSRKHPSLIASVNEVNSLLPDNLSTRLNASIESWCKSQKNIDNLTWLREVLQELDRALKQQSF